MRSVSSVLARCWARHAISRGDARVKREQRVFGVESFPLSRGGGGEEVGREREKEKENEKPNRETEKEKKTEKSRQGEGTNPPTWNASRRVRKISSVGVIIKKYVSLQTQAHRRTRTHARLGSLSSSFLTRLPLLQVFL